jgi:plastocyanin
MPYATANRFPRITLALILFGSVSATAPSQVTVLVVDQTDTPLRDAVVEIARPGGDSTAFAASSRNAMAQRNLAFVPGTMIVPAGATVAFPNLDAVRHSIYSFSPNARFQIDLYGRDQTRSQRFASSGTVAVGCKIHDRMRGYIRVTTTPYAAITQPNGQARIAGPGQGEYRVTIWHPKLRGANNEVTQTVRAVSGQTLRVQVSVR